MAVSNRSVYSNRLKCGTESLRHQSLFLPIPLNLPQPLDSTMLTADWIRSVLDPEYDSLVNEFSCSVRLDSLS